MASAKKVIIVPAVPAVERIEVLMTQDEVNTLRSLIGGTASGVTDRLNLNSLFDALQGVSTYSHSDYVIRHKNG